MANLLSNKINIFPSAKRGVEYPYARLTMEATFPNIINKLLDSNGFVITKSENVSLNGIFEFNIFGYYVKIDKLSTLTSTLFPSTTPATGTVIYAQITIDSANEISGQDVGGVYQGVTFNTSNSKDLSQYETDSVHNQLLCQWDGTNWIVPEEARLIFNKTSISSLTIDGGVI